MNFLRISHRAPLLLVKTGKSSLHSKSRSNLLWIGAIACFAPVQVYCVEEGKDKDEDKDPLKKFKEVWGITPDLLNKEITFGAIAGVCSGVVLKKLGSFLAILGGTMFLSLQFASHYGYIEGDMNFISRLYIEMERKWERKRNFSHLC